MNKPMLLDEVGQMALYHSSGQSEKDWKELNEHANNYIWWGPKRWRPMIYRTLTEVCCNIQRMVPVFHDTGVKLKGDKYSYVILTPKDHNGRYTVPARFDIPKKFHGMKVDTAQVVWPKELPLS